MYKYEILSNCTRKFSREDKEISCELINSESNTERTIETLEIKIFVEWGPLFSGDYYREINNTNKILTVGSTLELECPIEGHPIYFKWFDITNNKTYHSKEKKLSQKLPIGIYKFQCEGSVGKFTSLVKYSVNVTEDYKPEEVHAPQNSQVKCNYVLDNFF